MEISIVDLACYWLLSLGVAYCIGWAFGWRKGYTDGCRLVALYRGMYNTALDLVAEVTRDERESENDADWWKAGKRPPWEEAE